MKIIISILSFLIIHSPCFAQRSTPPFEKDLIKADTILQDSAFQLLHTLPVQSDQLIVDNLQNLYIATKTGQILKFNRKGQQQFEYNNNRLGKIGKIDVRNPLNILVYYPDLAIVVILDRTLSPIKELNLFDLNIIEPKGVAIANDNTVWVFDEVAAVLKKINQAGAISFESRNLNQLTQKNLSPSFLLEYNNHLYLSDPIHGLFIFDTFGQLHQTISIKGIERFQVIDNQIIFWRKGQLNMLFVDSLKEIPLKLPFAIESFHSFYITNQQIYIAKDQSIEIYDFKG